MFHEKGPTLLELARQALSSTEHGYDLLAPKFDYTPFRTPDAILDAVAPHIGPPRSVGRADLSSIERRHRLTAENERHRMVAFLNRNPPGYRGLVRVARPEDDQVGDRTQRRELFDRLVRRPVLA